MANAINSRIFDEVTKTLGLVPGWMRAVPECALPALWSTMRDFYLADTSIPAKYKELIGLAVAGATRCRYTALYHTEAARVHGANSHELAEASYMGGYTTLASTFITAQQIDPEQFRRDTHDIMRFTRLQPRRPDESLIGKRHLNV